jgi:hypothetical protein
VTPAYTQAGRPERPTGAGSLLSSERATPGRIAIRVFDAGCAGLQTPNSATGGTARDVGAGGLGLPRQVEFFGSARGIYNRGNGGLDADH